MFVGVAACQGPLLGHLHDVQVGEEEGPNVFFCFV